jgi:predicted GNAT family N-acyltransferase
MMYATCLLNNAHKKQLFKCGTKMLDDYLHAQAKQDVKRKLAVCFILADENDNVKGYYTLSNSSIDRNLLPESIIKKLPQSYNSLPVTLLGRLAVDEKYKGKKLGGLLLLDALKRSYENSQSSIGSMAVIVNPIDNVAKSFYEKYGFIILPDSDKMFLPMNTIANLF